MQRTQVAAAIIIVVAAAVLGAELRAGVFAGPNDRHPVATITLPAPGEIMPLYDGCNSVALTFPDGTASQTVVEAVTPAGIVQSMWRRDAPQNSYAGFSPAAPQASDLPTVDFLDPAWICLGEVTPQQPPTPPNRFFCTDPGCVTLDGSPAPAGTNVTGTIGGNICGETTVAADSTYVLDVVSSGQTAGCGTEGALVSFWLAGLTAGTATWHSGYFTQLDLSAAATSNKMAVDAVSGGGIDPSRTAMIDIPFHVDIVVTAAPNPYRAEQYKLEWVLGMLTYHSETPTFLDGLTLCGSPVLGANTVYNGCGATAPTTATGPVHTVTLSCEVEEGTSTLHLVTMVEDPTFGTTTSAGPGVVIDTTLTDASVTCSVCLYPNDSDCDGCADSEELGADPPLGGTRDPSNFWDFYDVPVPTAFNGGTLHDRDQAVSIINDLLAVLEYAGTSDEGLPNAGPDGIPGNADDRDYDQDNNGDGQDDGLLYDRSVGAAWSDAPNGAITIIEDVLLVLAQSGHSCQADP